MRTIQLPILIAAIVGVTNSVHAQSIYTPDADQCLGSMLNRYLWVKGENPSALALSNTEKYQLAHIHYSKDDIEGFNTVMNGPWDRALVPIKIAQEKAIADGLFVLDSSGRFIKLSESGYTTDYKSVHKFLTENQEKKLVSALDVLRKEMGAPAQSFEDLQNSPEESYTSWATNKAAITAACTQFSVLRSFSCVNATTELLNELSYRGNMILPKIWMNFFRDRKLKDGVRRAALKIIDRIESKKPGYILDDLTLSFKEAGFEDLEAEEAAWQVMALYGNGGANTGFRVALFNLKEEVSILSISLSIIGTSISHVDYTQRLGGNRHYAFPSEVRDSCLMPKPYHFWLSAYLARWLVNKGYSPEVAQMATFIVAKGYQVNRDLNNAGGGLDKILSKSSFHPTNQVIRLDLALSSSGAVYGSLVEKNLVNGFSINDGIAHLKHYSGNPEVLSQGSIQNLLISDRVRLLYIWDELFQPNKVLKFYQDMQRK